MSGISAIRPVSSYSSYGAIASGKRLQSAADGASELAIVEKENTQVTGYDVGADNMKSAQEMLNVSDGALGSIGDSLQRIRELALQASNTATTTDSDRQHYQREIDQLKQGISDIASQTQYNTKNLLNGTNTAFGIATDANGNMTTVNTGNATLEALGIADFDVTGDFDIGTIDDALSKVNRSRSEIGAQTNALDYAINYNSNASYNLTGAKSKLEDLDYPEAISDQKKEEILTTYSLLMQKKVQEQQEARMQRLLDGFF